MENLLGAFISCQTTPSNDNRTCILGPKHLNAFFSAHCQYPRNCSESCDLGYGSAYEITAIPYPGYSLADFHGYTNPYPGYSLATIYICQTIPWVHFGYSLHMPNHALGNVNIGYGLAVTPAVLG